MDFFILRVTGETFLLSDIIGLAYKWNLPIRNRPAQGVLGGNGNNQITMVFKDLLNDLKAANQGITAFTLFGKLKDVKKFAHLSDELREVLFQESILYVEKSSKTIRDNRKEIARLTRQCQYNQDILDESSSERSLSPKEGHGIGQRSAESAEQMSKIKDWKSAFELSLTRINEQKHTITKLSKLCLGALNAIDKMETNSQTAQNENGYRQEKNMPQSNTLPKKLTEKNDRAEIGSLNDTVSKLSHMVHLLKGNFETLEKEIKVNSNSCDVQNDVRKLVEEILIENHNRFISETGLNDKLNVMINNHSLITAMSERLGKI